MYLCLNVYYVAIVLQQMKKQRYTICLELEKVSMYIPG
jgi:hypothetical protein